jgi:ADP-ribose pyrophosphatase
MKKMKWTLLKAVKETNHPFLNYYTLYYDVEKADGHHPYSYFMATRKKEGFLVSQTKDYTKTDGVLIPLYYIDPSTKKISFLFTTQFRPPLNNYVHSVPAGLVDGDDDVKTTAIREAKEEVGADITDLEVLCLPCPTSSGLSDEMNSVVLGRITSFEYKNLEEFEDIEYELVPLEKVEEYMDTHFMAMQVRMLMKYLVLRFSTKKMTEKN